MYQDYYTAIQAVIASDLTSVQNVDWFNHQYENYPDIGAVSFPEVYVEFETPVVWQTGSDKLQTANTTISLHVVANNTSNDPSDVLAYAQDVHKVFQSKALENINEEDIASKFMRIESSLNMDTDQVQVAILRYSTCLFDTSAMNTYTEVMIDPLNIIRDPNL